MEQILVGITIFIMIFAPIITIGVGLVILKGILKFLGITK